MPTLTLQRKADEKTAAKTVQFTYEGASPDDAGPRGTLLRFLMAVASNDLEAGKALMTAKSQEASRGDSPDGDMEVKLGESTVEGNFTVIPAETKGGGQEISLPVHMIQEGGAWKVDLATTMDKLLGGMMEAMGGVMEQMAEGMGKMMEGIGEAMSQAFSGSAESPVLGEATEPSESISSAPFSKHGSVDDSDAHPIIEEWRPRWISATGMFTAVTVDWGSFRAEERRIEAEHGPGPDTIEAVVQTLLEELLEGVREVVPADAAFRDALANVGRFHFRRAAEKDIAYVADGRVVVFTVGENTVGGPDYYSRYEVEGALRGVLPSGAA